MGMWYYIVGALLLVVLIVAFLKIRKSSG